MVEKIFVREGEHVKQNTPIGLVASQTRLESNELLIDALIEKYDDQLNEIRQIAQSARKLSKIKSENVEVEIETANKRLSFLKKEQKLREYRVNLAKEEVNLYQSLEAHATRIERVRSQTRLADAELELASINRLISDQLGNVASRYKALDELSENSEKEQAEYERDELQIHEKLLVAKTNGKITLSAPIEARVSLIPVVEGAPVSAGDTIAALLESDAQLEIEVYLSERSVSSVIEGQEVLLRYDSLPFRKYGLQRGVVKYVSDIPDVTKSLNTSYHVRIQPFPTTQASSTEFQLLPGMTVSADIMIESKTLGQWITDPLIEAWVAFFI